MGGGEATCWDVLHARPSSEFTGRKHSGSGKHYADWQAATYLCGSEGVRRGTIRARYVNTCNIDAHNTLIFRTRYKLMFSWDAPVHGAPATRRRHTTAIYFVAPITRTRPRVYRGATEAETKMTGREQHPARSMRFLIFPRFCACPATLPLARVRACSHARVGRCRGGLAVLK
jgi:hypothetical protein